MTDRTYARVYHDLVDDPKFEKVYGNDRALATWLRMLLMADATYPVSAPMPPRTPTVRLLIDCGLIVENSGNRYQVKGLKAEREHRSASARNAAAVRWQSASNANAMPSKAEQSKAEQSKGANAPNGPTNGAAFMGFRPKASADDIKRQEAEDWAACADCGILKRKHPASGEHPFLAEGTDR